MKDRMIIEVRKAGFVNKGAELMLRAIMERVQAAYPEALLTMAPTHACGAMPFRKVVDHGFYPKASLYQYGFQLGDLAKLAPRKLREMYGLVLDRDVDVVIDAAGFSYSDQWGDRSSRELAHSAARWRKQGYEGDPDAPGFRPIHEHGHSQVDSECSRQYRFGHASGANLL